MATLLYRIGHFCARNRKSVLAGWLLALIGFGAGAGLLMGNLSSEITIPGLKSASALEKLADNLPAAGGITGRIVLQTEDGTTLADPQNQAIINDIVQETSQLEAVESVSPPLPGNSISEDGTIGFVSIVFSAEMGAIPADSIQGISDLAEEHSSDALQIGVGGAAVEQMPAIGSTEAVGVVIAMVVLLITFGSIVAAGLPLLTALIGIGVGLSGIMIVSGFTDMTETAPILALMLGLAVGIDYALFIVSKHRDLLRRGMSVPEAIARANGTAGTAVVFAGLTVVIALAALTVVGIPFLGVMGLGSAFTVMIAVLIAITLVPALLGFAGYKVLPKKIRAQVMAHEGEPISAEDNHTPNRWISFIDRRPVAALLGGIILLGLIALPATQLRLGLPSDGTASPDSSQRIAHEMVVEGFGDGANNPLIILVEPDEPLALSAEEAAAVEAQVGQQLQEQVAANPELLQYAGDPAMLQMAFAQGQAAALMQPYITAIAELDNVASVNAVAGTEDGMFFVLQVVPGTNAEDVRTEQLVHDLRDLGADLGAQYGAEFEVTGLNIIQMDISEKLADALPIYLIIVVGLAFILLFFVFRSLLVPIKAVLGFLLSIAASFGAVVAVYQLGWMQWLFGVDTPAPIISFLPILLIGILFGLSMDYEMFLVSGMREAHAHGLPARRAVTTGYMAGSRVVTAAAIIMISVFGGFILAPDAIIASIGFALAIGVLFDAFVVRMTIVPAVMRLMGEKAWYLPRWMDKVIPHADVEGTKLLERLEKQDAKDEKQLETVG